jgi:hypothetical protein
VNVLMLPVRRPLTVDDAIEVLDELAGQQLPVVLAADQAVVHLFPQRDMTTREEVRVLRCCSAHTDARLVWHPCR